jgi:hypothetical protein
LIFPLHPEAARFRASTLEPAASSQLALPAFGGFDSFVIISRSVFESSTF